MVVGAVMLYDESYFVLILDFIHVSFPASKILSMLVMFIGRLGPMTIVTLWYFSHGERVRYPEGNISIG